MYVLEIPSKQKVLDKTAVNRQTLIFALPNSNFHRKIIVFTHVRVLNNAVWFFS